MRLNRKISTVVFAVLILITVISVNKKVSHAEDFSDAVTIQVNQTVGDFVEKGYDYQQNYYKFTVYEPGSVEIKFFTPLQSNSDAYWYVYFYNSEYTELFNMNIYGNKTSTESLTTGIPAGTYYIRVNSSGWRDVSSTDMYTLEVEYTASNMWEKELNEEFTTATDISLETEYYGTTWAGHDYEKDFYKFIIPKTGLYSIGVSTPNLNDAGKYWNLYLYNESYEKLESQSIYGNKTFHAISRTLPAGTYYLEVNSAGWRDVSSTEQYVLKVASTTTEGIQAICEHNYGSYYVDATYFSKGYRVYTCEKCGYSYKGDYSDKKLLEQGYLNSYCSTGKGKLYLSWSTVSDATGYQIRYSTDKSFKTGVVVKNVIGQSVSSKTISKLSRKKKYYVQIRPYVKEADKKAYGKWSAKMVLKTK